MDSFREELLETFKEEAEELLAKWESCTLRFEESHSLEDLKELFRVAHTLKGTSKTVGFNEFGDLVHEIEDVIRAAQAQSIKDLSGFVSYLLKAHQVMDSWLETKESRPADIQILVEMASILTGGGEASPTQEPEKTEISPAREHNDAAKNWLNEDHLKNGVTPLKDEKESSASPVSPTAGAPTSSKASSKSASSSGSNEVVRVKREKIDKMINYVGELGTQLAVLDHQYRAKQFDSKESEEALEYCLKYIKQLQEYTIALSLQPIDRFMQRLERSCKDVARATSKKIDVEKRGTSIELDKTVLDQIADPFIHIVRNAADHGIEDPSVRKSKGKSETGNILIKAEQKSGVVEITVKDDGSGLDRDAIWSKAVEKGLLKPDEDVTDDQVYQMILKPGFSTKAAVTDISGRGVGLDVVAATLESLSGNLRIESQKGSGTSFIVSIPTNFSMVESVLVDVGGNRYGIPLKDFSEIIDLGDFDIKRSDVGDHFFKMRNEVVAINEMAGFLSQCDDDEGPSSEEGDHEEIEVKRKQIAAVINRATHQPIAFKIDKLYGRLNLFVKPLNGKMSRMLGVSGTAILPDGQAGLVLNLSEIARLQVEETTAQVKYG